MPHVARLNAILAVIFQLFCPTPCLKIVKNEIARRRTRSSGSEYHDVKITIKTEKQSIEGDRIPPRLYPTYNLE
jgi:hypothetical protein